MVACGRHDAGLPGGTRVQNARSSTGRAGAPRLVPDDVLRSRVACVLPVRRVVGARRRERHVALRVPAPAVLELRAADSRDVRARCRPAVGREVVVHAVAVLLRDANRAAVARRCEERVALRVPLLENGIEFLRRLFRRAAERLLGNTEAHREDRPARIRVDGVGDRLEQVRESLHALRLRRRDPDQNDVRERCDRVRPLDVERGLTGPALRSARAGLSFADVLEVGRPVRVHRRVVRRRQGRVEGVVECLQVGRAVRLAVRVDEHDRLPLPEQALPRSRRCSWVPDLVDAVGRANLLRRVAVDPGIRLHRRRRSAGGCRCIVRRSDAVRGHNGPRRSSRGG